MTNIFYLLLIISIIWLFGYFTLAIFKEFLNTVKPLSLIALSWLTGCVVISSSYLYCLLLRFFGIDIDFTIISLIPTLILLVFIKRIIKNTLILIEKYKTDINNYTFKFELSLILYLIFFLFIAIFTIEIFMINFSKPVWAWDSWVIWTFKAKLLYYDILTPEFLSNTNYSYTHPDYPLLIPIIQSYISKFLGIFDERYTQIFFSLSYLSYIFIIYDFIRNKFNKLFSIVLVLPFISIPVLVLNFTGAHADCIVAVFNLVLIYYIYNYLFKEKTNLFLLIPVTIATAGIIMTKNEGALIVICTGIISIITAYMLKNEYLTKIKYLIIAFFTGFMINLPWFLYLKLTGTDNDVIAITNISNVNISESISKIPYIISFINTENILNISVWGILFYIYIAFIGYALIKKYYILLIFFTGTFLLELIGLITIYAISPHDLNLHLYSSSDRVILGFSPLVSLFIITVLGQNNICENLEKKPKPEISQ